MLSEHEVGRLLDDMCTKLGPCATPADRFKLQRDPLRDVRAFTDAVCLAEVWTSTGPDRIFAGRCEISSRRRSSATATATPDCFCEPASAAEAPAARREVTLEASMQIDPLKRDLEVLERRLAQHGEVADARSVRAALRGADRDLLAFLTSNELWGGAGSIADQSAACADRRIGRRIEAALVVLGREQIRQGVVNARTGLWVDTFTKWRREGV